MGNNTNKTIGKNRRSVLTNLGTCVQTHILKYCINTSLWLRRWIEMIFNVLIAIVPVGVDITQRNASCAQYICVFNCSKRNYHYFTSVNLIYRSAARSVTMSLYFTGHMPHGMDGGKYRCMFWHLWCLICFLNRFPLKMLRSEEKTIKCKQVVSYKIADFYHNDIQTPFCKHTPSPFFSSQTGFHSLLFLNTINSYSTYMHVNILYVYIYYTML